MLISILTDEDEFLLSRLADGDLNEDENAHVQAVLASSAPARARVASYASLSLLLRAAALSESDPHALIVARDEMLDALRAEMHRDSRVMGSRNRSFWSGATRRIALAAALLLGIATSLHYVTPSSPPVGGSGVGGDSLVFTKVPSGSARTLKVDIGPSEAIANVPPEQLYSKELNQATPRVEISPESLPAVDRRAHDPF